MYGCVSFHWPKDKLALSSVHYTYFSATKWIFLNYLIIETF